MLQLGFPRLPFLPLSNAMHNQRAGAPSASTILKSRVPFAPFRSAMGEKFGELLLVGLLVLEFEFAADC